MARFLSYLSFRAMKMGNFKIEDLFLAARTSSFFSETERGRIPLPQQPEKEPFQNQLSSSFRFVLA